MVSKGTKMVGSRITDLRYGELLDILNDVNRKRKEASKPEHTVSSLMNDMIGSYIEHYKLKHIGLSPQSTESHAQTDGVNPIEPVPYQRGVRYAPGTLVILPGGRIARAPEVDGDGREIPE